MTDDDTTDAPRTALEAAVEHAIDAFVYAPIGLLFEGSELLPDLIEKGRNQVTMARMVGKFALEQGRAEAIKQAGKLGDQAAGLLDFLGTSLAGTASADDGGGDAPEPTRMTPTPPRAPGAARAAARAIAGGGDGPLTAPAPVTVPVPVAADDPTGSAAVASADALAIPDYDGLSASQVVNRLAGLSTSELEAVRTYEAAHRGRKTILSKVAQLQAS